MAEKLKQQSKGQAKAQAAKNQKAGPPAACLSGRQGRAGAQQVKSQPMKKSGHSCSCC